MGHVLPHRSALALLASRLAERKSSMMWLVKKKRGKKIHVKSTISHDGKAA